MTTTIKIENKIVSIGRGETNRVTMTYEEFARRFHVRIKIKNKNEKKTLTFVA